jgi:hypothetical protein
MEANRETQALVTLPGFLEPTGRIALLLWSLQRGENSLTCARNRTRFTVLQAVVIIQTDLLRVQTQQQCKRLMRPRRLE